MSEVTQVSPVPPPSLTLSQAFDSTAPERANVVEMQHITVNVPSAVATVFGSLPNVRAQRSVIDATFKAFPMRYLDNLESYASGALYAHSAWLFATTPPADVQELIAEATRRRVRVISVLEVASAHGLIPAEVLTDLQGPKGHKNIAVDLIGAISVLRQYWSSLEGKVPMTSSDLEQTQELGKKLLQAVGVRDQAPGPDDQLSVDRKRAFTLLAEAYGEVRDAILYVRRHTGDGDDIAPSLFAGRGGSKKKDDGGTDVQTTTATQTGASAHTASAAPVGHPDSNPLTA